jgi:hypothetical protein
MHQDEDIEQIIIFDRCSKEISRHFTVNFHFTLAVAPTSDATYAMKQAFSIVHVVRKQFLLEVLIFTI